MAILSVTFQDNDRWHGTFLPDAAGRGPRDDQRVGHEYLVTGERRLLEWGGVRLVIDMNDDPALLFWCEGQAAQ